jgi:leader peptidase (prepilin peptidase)/N-methyltransferase
LLAALIAAAVGLIIGSFLNVCIFRLPRDLSVASPARSFCPSCEKTIAWYDNIPIASYFLLRRHCRHCGAAIPLRYPLVEALTALSFFGAVYLHGVSAAGARLAIFCALIIALIFTDIEERILPDEMTLGGAIAGVVFAWFVPMRTGLVSVLLFRHSLRTQSLGESLVGALVGSIGVWAIGELYRKVRHREGLGLGDVKMLAMTGAFLGLEGSFLIIMIGSLLGAVSGLVFIKATGRDMSSYELPFGSFLGVAALAIAFLTDPALHLYSHAGG